MTYDRIAAAVHDAVGAQTRRYLARVIGVVLPNGMIPCYSEALGNVTVLFRSTDGLSVNDWIYIYKASQEKHSPWMYGGFASGGNASEKRPPISQDTTIQVVAPRDGGHANPPVPTTTLTDALNIVAAHLRAIQGTESWTDAVPSTSLMEVVTWRSPVLTATSLPPVGNRFGDVRIAVDTGIIYVWGSSGWRSPVVSSTGGGSTPIAPSSSASVVMVGAYSMSAFMLVALMETGGVAASALEIHHAGRIVGITLESAGVGADVLVHTHGEVVLPFSAPQGPVFLGTGGLLSASLVTGAIFAQPLGVVVGSRLFLSIDPSPVMLASPAVSGGGEGVGMPGYIPTMNGPTAWIDVTTWDRPNCGPDQYLTVQMKTYAPPGYWKADDGMVYLRGAVIRTGVVTLDGGTTLFHLPVDYRPEFFQSFPVVSTEPAALVSSVIVSPDGAVMYVHTSTASFIAGSITEVTFHLDPIVFRAYTMAL